VKNLEPPPPARLVLGMLSGGQSFPQIKEADMGEVGAFAQGLVDAVPDLAGPIGVAGTRLREGLSGPVADLMSQSMDQLTAAPGDLKAVFQGMADSANNTALQTAHAKYMIIAQAMWTAVETMNLLSLLPESLPEIGGVLAVARAVIPKIMQQFFKRIAFDAALQAGSQAGLDAIVQKIEIDQGIRHGVVDLSEVATSAALGRRAARWAARSTWARRRSSPRASPATPSRKPPRWWVSRSRRRPARGRVSGLARRCCITRWRRWCSARPTAWPSGR